MIDAFCARREKQARPPSITWERLTILEKMAWIKRIMLPKRKLFRLVPWSFLAHQGIWLGAN